MMITELQMTIVRWWMIQVSRCPVTFLHYNDVIMSVMVSQITNLTIVYSTVYSGADQRKRQSSVSLAFVRGIHRWPGNSPHKGPVTRKMFPFDDVIMVNELTNTSGPQFNIKMTSYQCRKSHCGDKTILRPSYLHNGISYTGKMVSLYWIRALVLEPDCTGETRSAP